jgi:hypothetical protein
MKRLFVSKDTNNPKEVGAQKSHVCLCRASFTRDILFTALECGL